MRVLVTGGLGLIGRSVVAALLLAGHSVRLFDTLRAGRLRKILHRLPTGKRQRLRRAVLMAARNEARHQGVNPSMDLQVIRGDLCNIADVGEAVRGVDAVVHLGAMIPPAADRYPVRADYVNRGGVQNIVAALKERAPSARLVYTSSVAVYGDRRAAPFIRLGDKPNPNPEDHYAIQKLAAEGIVRGSGLDWVIFRLSAIFSPDKLQMDPLMFDMPLDTCLEMCSAEDVATALARAVESNGVSRRVMHIAGGQQCRTTFGEYMDTMMQLFGLGKGFLPPQAFGQGPFHCAWMDTSDSQALLHYQEHTLDDYYESVRRVVRFRRPFFRLLRGPIRAYLLSRSPHLREHLRRLDATRRRRARFGWIFAGRRAHQLM